MFEVIEGCNPNYRNIVMTVIHGEYFGEKVLVSNHEIVWESLENGFFAKNKEEILCVEESGMREVKGNIIFSEFLGREKKIVICGGGHVSMPLIRMGLMIGCLVTVLEDRPKFADNARREGATRVICEPFQEGLKQVEGDKDTFFVIVTRGHRYDQICLESIIEKKHAYIGMIGSRRRVIKVKESVLEKGGNSEVVDKVYTPIGLNIGAETPEEIAIAIMAEIIEVKNKKKQGLGYSKEIIQAVLSKESELKNKVLATIVMRKGSAPREMGTKMLIFTDGTCVGTIGGGCVESDIFQTGLLMLRTGKTEPKVCHVDMSGYNAENEGMVCGGIIKVLMEVI